MPYCNLLSNPHRILFVPSNILSREIFHQCPFKMDSDQLKQRFNTKFREVRDCNPSLVERLSILYIIQNRYSGSIQILTVHYK